MYLAERTGTSMAGAILGDFAKGPDLSRYPADIAEGIRLHRRTDSLTDAHPGVASLRERWHRPLRRYAPILIDIGLDHSLARHWSAFHGHELAVFARRAQAELIQAQAWFPQPMRLRLDRFAELLCAYASSAGLGIALARTAARLRRPYDAAAALALIEEERGRFDALLAPLLTDLTADLQTAIAAGPNRGRPR